jgi:hypothetical protein
VSGPFYFVAVDVLGPNANAKNAPPLGQQLVVVFALYVQDFLRGREPDASLQPIHVDAEWLFTEVYFNFLWLFQFA